MGQDIDQRGEHFREKLGATIPAGNESFLGGDELPACFSDVSRLFICAAAA